RPHEFLLNPLGSVHGSYYAALLDSALGCAIHSTLPAGTGYTTLEYKINMVRALKSDGETVFAEGRVLHPGRRVATSEATLKDAEGRLYGHGTCSCLIFPAEGG
ncbi:MAG TPA: PaaI family thioesterase, partial [Alphaproteobacteria bacterium]|nr:PaaI family thioesterase [Alphaproteobacteria bacterium]